MILAGVVPALLHAQAPSIALSIGPENPGPTAASPALEEILRVTIDLAAEERGFRTIPDPAGVAATPQAEFLLSVRYSLTGNRVTLRFRLTDTRSVLPESSGSLERTLDPQFDREVSILVAEILLPAEREVAVRPRTAPASVPAVESPQAAAAPGQAGLSGAAANAAAPAEAAGTELGGSERRLSRRPPRPDFGAGVYLPLGHAGDYFSAAGWFDARWGFPLGQTGPWSAGPAAAVTAFSMAGPDETESGNYFMMLGAELGFRVPGAGKVSPFASVSAGPALVVVRDADPERYAKLMPYAAARVGASLQAGPR